MPESEHGAIPFLPPGLVGPLDAAELRRLIAADPPLLTGVDNLDQQLQPHGIDLRLDGIWRLAGAGRLGRDARDLPHREPLGFDAEGWADLPAGSYVCRLREAVCLPADVLALGFPRSSLLRCGVDVHTALWDAGYRGRSEVLLTVLNPAGLRLQQGTRILQLLFFRLPRATAGYAGRYQDEHLEGRSSR